VFLGAEDTRLNRECFTRQMIASVARIMQPGCQHDTMLVLQGEQGIRKSSFIRALYGDAAFTDQASLSDCHNKDNLAMLVGHWGVEFPELSGLRKGEVEDVKKFITSRSDVFRAPYARALSDNPRTCVLWGTTNDPAPLMDSTGNRRFQIITCSKRLTTEELEEIRRERDQIWAEAVHLYKSGARWWFGDDEQDLTDAARTEAAKHVAEDPMQDTVSSIIEEEVAKNNGVASYIKASTVLERTGTNRSPRAFAEVKRALELCALAQTSPRLGGVKTRVYVPIFRDVKTEMNQGPALAIRIMAEFRDAQTITLDDVMAALVDGNGTELHASVIRSTMSTIPGVRWSSNNTWTVLSNNA